MGKHANTIFHLKPSLRTFSIYNALNLANVLRFTAETVESIVYFFDRVYYKPVLAHVFEDAAGLGT